MSKKVSYVIFDRKCVYKKGLDKCYLRTVPSKRLADIFTGKDNDSYIVKKVSVR